MNCLSGANSLVLLLPGDIFKSILVYYGHLKRCLSYARSVHAVQFRLMSPVGFMLVDKQADEAGGQHGLVVNPGVGLGEEAGGISAGASHQLRHATRMKFSVGGHVVDPAAEGHPSILALAASLGPQHGWGDAEGGRRGIEAAQVSVGTGDASPIEGRMTGLERYLTARLVIPGSLRRRRGQTGKRSETRNGHSRDGRARRGRHQPSGGRGGGGIGASRKGREKSRDEMFGPGWFGFRCQGGF